MKKYRLSRLIIVAVVAVSAMACLGKKPPILTPPASVVTQPGRTAYTADQIVVRINELERIAVAGNKDGSISDDIAIPIVKFCVAADKVAKVSPAGFKAALATSWAELKQTLKGKTLPVAIVTTFSLVDGVIASYAGVSQ